MFLPYNKWLTNHSHCLNLHCWCWVQCTVPTLYPTSCKS
uniref:Uncharacterized protein n=1 Tax=Anguilla anguilla TaxID=7936 RepID=A0A0E9PDG1_ANGAN